MANRRNIRKRNFEATKSLKLYRDYESLFKFTMGENANESNLSTFEASEKFDNNNKITEMLSKKKKNVIIPAINYKNGKDDGSERSENTDITQILKKEEKEPVKFNFEPMGPPPSSFIKYKPKMVGVENEQDYSKIDYLLPEEDWNDSKSHYKSITENLRDLVEECFDKMEKLTGKGETPSMDECKHTILNQKLLTQPRPPTDPQIRAIYSAWIAQRKKHNNPLLRIFWRKPDPNDNSPNASFRSRVAEKMQTRRKNKNDNSNYMKLKLLSKEVFAGRTLVGKVMEREKLKLAQLDLDYLELRQMLKRKTQPDYKSKELKEYMDKYTENTKVKYPENLVEPVKSEADDEMKDDISSIAPSNSGVSERERKRRDKHVDIPSNLHIPTQPTSRKTDTLEERQTRNMPSSQHLPTRQPMQPRAKQHESITVDPTTVMQIGVMFKKFYYFGITADRNRIKINNHKPIKKEEYLNLTQAEVEEEQYQRVGIKPKPEQEVSPSTTSIKYMIFRARNGRVIIKRKPVGGEYQKMDDRSHCQLTRLKPERANHLKRVRADIDTMDTFSKNNHIPVLQNVVNKRFKQFDFLEESEPDEETTNDEPEKQDDDDDYAKEFIARYRKRNNKMHISVPL